MMSPSTLASASLRHYERRLNMKSGTLDREVLWETPSGKEVQIKSRRLISFRQRHVAAVSYEVTLLNAEAPLVVSVGDAGAATGSKRGRR